MYVLINKLPNKSIKRDINNIFLSIKIILHFLINFKVAATISFTSNFNLKNKSYFYVNYKLKLNTKK